MSENVVAGRYRILERLGHGPMSEVFLAEDLELGRRVALKLLGRDADPARFEREARAAAALTHPNVNQLFDYGEVAGRPFMVLEYLSGGTLEDRLRASRTLPDAETEEIARGVAAGLAHAHERGLVHRDLKPSNVLFDDEGRPKIADFGIARMGGAGTLTEAGTVMGTATYISPEQAAGEAAGPASDVYSFGVILFRMLTGRLPFESERPMELVAMHRDLPAPPVEVIRPDAPPALAAIVKSALAKDPADRPADGRALAATLGVPQAGPDETATAILPPPRHRAPVPPAGERRRSRLLPAIIGVLALAAAGVALAVVSLRDSGSTASTTSSSTRSSTRSTTTTTTVIPAATSTSSTTQTTSPTTRPTTSRPTTTATPLPPPPPPPVSTTATTPPPPPPESTGTTTTITIP